MTPAEHAAALEHLLEIPHETATEQRLALSMALTALAVSRPKHIRWEAQRIAARKAIMEQLRRAA